MAENVHYAINEGTLPLDVPETWEDQTIHVLRLPGDGRATASELCADLGVTRQTLYRHVTPDGQIRPDGEKLLGRTVRHRSPRNPVATAIVQTT